jgi:hypothetical protein
MSSDFAIGLFALFRLLLEMVVYAREGKAGIRRNEELYALRSCVLVIALLFVADLVRE